jgi:hypothetical protein
MFDVNGSRALAGATTVWQVTTESPSGPSAPATDPTPGSPVAGAADDGVTRYRCGACGNLTRFNVLTNRRTRAFHHFSVGGELSVEDVEVLAESVEEVSCRWCGNGNAVEVIQGGAPERE